MNELLTEVGCTVVDEEPLLFRVSLGEEEEETELACWKLVVDDDGEAKEVEVEEVEPPVDVYMKIMRDSLS